MNQEQKCCERVWLTRCPPWLSHASSCKACAGCGRHTSVVLPPLPSHSKPVGWREAVEKQRKEDEERGRKLREEENPWKKDNPSEARVWCDESCKDGCDHPMPKTVGVAEATPSGGVPQPDHEARGEARLNTADAHDDAGLEGWLNDWMPNTDGLTLDGDSRGAKDRLRAVFAKALSSSEKAARAEVERETLEWVLAMLQEEENGTIEEYSRKKNEGAQWKTVVLDHDGGIRRRIGRVLAALKVDLKEGRI